MMSGVVGWLVAVQPQGSAWLGGGVVLCYLGLFVCVCVCYVRRVGSSKIKADEEERRARGRASSVLIAAERSDGIW